MLRGIPNIFRCFIVLFEWFESPPWKRPRLSNQTWKTLRKIAEEESLRDLFERDPDLTYKDIRAAACEVLGRQLPQVDADESQMELPLDESCRSRESGHAQVRKPAPSAPRIAKTERLLPARAGAPWSREEEEELLRLVRSSASTREIARRLQRKPGGIRKRLAKLVTGK